MQETEKIWQNGELIAWKDAKVHALSHTLHYGGGAFEGIRIYKSTKGSAIFRLDEHIDRLFYSAQVLKMNIPYSKDHIKSAIIDVVRINRLEKGYIRPIVLYGYGGMALNPTGLPLEVIIACWPWGAYLKHDSVDIKISNYIRIHHQSTDVAAKICGHYVNSILAALELNGTAFHEALLLDSDGFIAEGVGENFFMVKDGILYTPTSKSILPGLTRDTIFKLAPTLGLDVIEKDITPEEAITADEAFFTGTAVEVTSIRSINQHIISNNQIGPITAAIKKAYLDTVEGRNQESPAFQNFLTWV